MASPAASTARTGEPRSRAARANPATRVAPVRGRAARPELQVIPGRRGAVRLALLLGATLFSLLFAVTAFQTRLAQNQLDIDRTDDEIEVQRERYDQLRLERAELLAPERLMAEAAALGMVPGSATEFVTVDPDVVAQVAVSAGQVPESARRHGDDPLEEYGAVKATVDGAG